MASLPHGRGSLGRAPEVLSALICVDLWLVLRHLLGQLHALGLGGSSEVFGLGQSICAEIDARLAQDKWGGARGVGGYNVRAQLGMERAHIGHHNRLT